MKICEDFPSNFGDKRTGCCITTKHLLTIPFSPENFDKKITIVPHTPYFSVSPIEDKTERPPF
jgi:hypothetical protein